ncbi:MAG: rod shape-determining protein RodA [Ignavibacteriaceae bacterium]|nr:rod shape-determining protein RodA [Ignavibacteriaceae bacterium]
MKIGSKLSDKIDLITLLAVGILLVIGILAIYSATFNTVYEKGNFIKQLIALGLSVILFIVIYSIPHTFFKDFSYPLYAFGIFTLVLVLIIGRTVGGAKAWIAFGPFSYQPAEFAKLFTIMAIAKFLSDENRDIENLKDLGITLGIGLAPILLILLEPDLGSALVFMGFLITLIFWKGMSLFTLFLVLGPPVVIVASLFGIYYTLGAFVLIIALLFYFKKDLFFSSAILAVNFASAFFVDYLFHILKPHQRSRILSFIDPNSDPLGAGYNAIQAQIAIGSGGLLGKGFMQGNQTQLQYIPKQWTDFIYCVIGEEFGFAGSFLVVILFTVISFRIVKLASATKDPFLSLLLSGIFAIFFIHFSINVGMTIGMMPVIGIPLPFVSYGGSSLLSNTLMLAIYMNIYRSRKEFS